jgi:hypothetical protein
MLRGFDEFERDEFDDSPWEPDPSGTGREQGRGSGGGSQTDDSVSSRLEKLHETEFWSDQLSRQSREHPEADGTSLETPGKLAERGRTIYRDRGRNYSLRPSEIHTLTEVGKFRVVSVEDLANHAYAGDRARMGSDLRGLIQQRLVERRETSAFKKESQPVLTLTKQGQRLILRNGFVDKDQVIHSGFVKPKEADHDAALYRLYYKAAGEIEGKGGKLLRVQLDYELKQKLYRKFGQVQGNGQTQRSKESLARELQLPTVHGKVSFPDVRIEYTTEDMKIARVDLELVTGHYHAGHLEKKARAGFQIYARSGDAPRLRSVRDQQEIMTAILSL